MDHVLLLVFHHIIFDAWSERIFNYEFSTLYEAFSKGKPSPLPELSIQYSDFVDWQQHQLKDEILETQLSYWKGKLDGTPASLDLPTDNPRPAIQTYRGRSHSLILSSSLLNSLKGLSHHENVTLFMILLAAFQTLLQRYTGQDDIVVGSPIAGRNQAETEEMIGFFVNSLVLRTNLSGNPTFQELLERIRETVLGALTHKDLPFEKLVNELQPKRDPSRTPVFQVLFNFENIPEKATETHDLRIEEFEFETGFAKFDLTLEIIEKDEGLSCIFEYKTDLFESSTIKRISRNFKNLLESIITNPKQLISDLQLLSKNQRHQLLIEWNETQADFPESSCIHQLFENQVQRTPDAIAAIFDDKHVTYRELNSRANHLAQHLHFLGVGPEVLVGVFINRSLEMVLGLLGILKAGGAYIPLDPSYPPEHLAYLMEDSQLSVVLTESSLLRQFPQTDAQVICIDTDCQPNAMVKKQNPTSNVSPENLAYVIYTSGSTGRPKGAMNTHGALCNRLLWMQEKFQLDMEDCVLQKTPFSFDVSIWEFFWPLMTGARLVLARPEGHRDRGYLVQLIANQRITTVHFVPTMLEIFLEDPSIESCHGLKCVICSGEALPLNLQESYFERLSAGLHNLYGPTEAAIDVTFFKCKPQGRNQIVPIGRPVANTEMYILDSYYQPVPVGVAGELHIGGVPVGRGYLNRPDLSAEKFINDPFSNSQGARLYKTGDLARYLTDGNIEFLGRMDHQVKFHGLRIELGEIEEKLKRHEAIDQVVVICKEVELLDDHSNSTDRNQRLIAYIVGKQDSTLETSVLHTYLKNKIPEYMIPSAFVFLEILPLLANGKIDRSSLPKPDPASTDPVEYVAPRNDAEKILARIWEEVLGIERVSVHDNFFELGGDSILSIQIIAQANKEKLNLNSSLFFMNQTIAELAKVSQNEPSIPSEQSIVTGNVPFTPIQHWFFEMDLPVPSYFNQSIFLEVQLEMLSSTEQDDITGNELRSSNSSCKSALVRKLELNTRTLEKAVQSLVVHHDALRLRFYPSQSGWNQRIVNKNIDDELLVTVVDLSSITMQKHKSSIKSEITRCHASLNITEGPLIRIIYFRLGEVERDKLLVVIHHLAVDEVSWQILMGDLWEAYQQLIRGQTVQFPLKTTSFKNWAINLIDFARPENLGNELAYWLSLDWEQVPHLPIDFSKGVNSANSELHVTVTLSEAKTHALLHDIHKAYNSQINDVLLTALIQSFSKWTGNAYQLIELEGHGREENLFQADLSRTVGWFTSRFPVLLKLEGTDDWDKAVTSVKEQLRSIPHKGVGFGILRYLMHDPEISRKLASLPHPEVSFNYLGRVDKKIMRSTPFKEIRYGFGDKNRSRKGNRKYLHDIVAKVTEGKFSVCWRYSTNQYQQSSIKQFANNFIVELESLIHHCLSQKNQRFTPSDFPNARLTQEEIAQFIKKIN